MKHSIVILLLCSVRLFAQTTTGTVIEKKTNGQTEALVGATLRWKNANDGTATNAEGQFTLAKKPENHELIVSMLGYRSDTLMVHSDAPIAIYLEPEGTDLQEVEVRGGATVIDRLNPIQTEIITAKALAKAACCNLSESFETNASISVSYADAVTGAKQIQLLGLSGNYVQTNTENIPSIRGLNTVFGLNFTPGTWVQSIDVGKGAGSVVNGYESMTGQINVELQKPDLAEKLYLNTYFNSFGRGEINLNLAHKLNKRWSVGLLTHASTMQTNLDKNKDGFLDLPKYTQYNVLNRWKYQSERFMAQFGVKALYEDRLGGQLGFRPEMRGTSQAYGFGSMTQRVEVFSKTAMLFPEKPYKGLGLIINGLLHNNQSYFGFKNYSGQQQTVYANLIYQNIIDNTNHQYKAGLSYLHDNYDETLSGLGVRQRMESVPGVFGEYTYTYPNKFTLVAGGRVDFHNLYGTRFTPRLHLKYDLSTNTHLRASAGRGWRVPNPLAENYGLLVSNRRIVIEGNLLPEESWNYGLSLTNEFTFLGQKGSLIVDAFRTDFSNALVADMETHAELRFYNLPGKSFSNSFQIELNYNPIKRLETKLAYRLTDVQNDYRTENGELLRLPKQFINRDRILFNAAYALPYDKWKFDFTWQWNGSRRIPDMTIGHVHSASSVSVFAPAFSNINAQVTRTFKKWDLYVGGENLNNFTQKNPIMQPNNPFGTDFDAGMAWGPVIGRMMYAGMRYKIK